MVSSFLATGLVFAGAFILVASLIPVRRLIRQLPSKQLRKQWYMLTFFIRKTIRHSDTAARYGGEEFLVIAPSTNSSVAITLAERLRQCIESNWLKLPRNSEEQSEIQITVSIGVANLSSKIDNSKKLFGAADEALYRAKQEGRNHVIQSPI